MKPDDALRIIEDIKSELFDELEKEILSEAVLYITVANDHDVMVELWDHKQDTAYSASLLQLINRWYEDCETDRTLNDLATGFEEIAKWLRKQAGRTQ